MSGNESGVTSGDQSTIEQGNVSRIVAKNEADAASTFDASSQSDSSKFDSFPKGINDGKQGKHIPGHKNFQQGKSELSISIMEANRLVDVYSGKGTSIGDNKERVDFGMNIGYYIDPVTGAKHPTTVGIIHYSKSGTHIVPARPKEV